MIHSVERQPPRRWKHPSFSAKSRDPSYLRGTSCIARRAFKLMILIFRLSEIEGEWHELETKLERAKKRRRTEGGSSQQA
jgi:hypothetical protein